MGDPAGPDAGRAEALLAAAGDPGARRLVLRRYAPLAYTAAVVRLRDAAPCFVEAAGLAGAVVACAGPWRTAGEWWADTAWSREEWDVALPDGAVYRLACDRATGEWVIDAVYD